MKVLVNCTGFIGDILFASCLAKKIKIMMPQAEITYNIPLPQPKLLLEENPNIDHVVVQQYMDPREFRYVFDMPVVDQTYPATIQFQNAIGIPQEIQSPEFYVHTVSKWDEWVENRFIQVGQKRPWIAYQVDWAWRAYACTKETLEQGIGAPHRDTDRIITELSKHFELVGVGFDRNSPSSNPITQDPEGYAKTASIIKACSWFIGSEGGLQNLAAAVGTKCIITSDFIAQNYWKRGRIKQIDNPKMGSHIYFPNAGHSLLHPCLSDNEIIDKVKFLINNNCNEIFNWETDLFS